MIQGDVAPRFAAVREAFEGNFASGLEQGAAVAVFIDGEPVVDLWGGLRDPARQLPWQRDTLVNVWSVTKGVVALAVAMLAERGQLDCAAPVARYWPEFGVRGKEALTLDHVLSHRAGLEGLDVPMTLERMYAWTPMVEALAAMAPLSPPGSRCIYHPMTYGHLAGEVIRRVDGRSPGRFIAEEIAQPLGLSFFVGLPQAEDHRAAVMSSVPPVFELAVLRKGTPYAHAHDNPRVTIEAPNDRAWRAAEIPGANGTGDAMSLATIYGALACGGAIRGHRYLSPEGLARATAERFRGLDVFGAPTVFAGGFRIEGPAFCGFPNPGHFGHAGWGGSLAFADPAHRLGFAYVTNRQMEQDDGIDPRRRALLSALYSALG